MKLSEHGKHQVQDWLLKNHVRGLELIKVDYVLRDWYKEAEDVYNSGHAFPTIMIKADYSLQTKMDIYLLIPDDWMIENHIDSRIGLDDQIRPDLMGRKIRDWC